MTDPAASATPPVVPGYALVEVIGRGASSTVWSARSEESGELRAVKVTSPAQDPRYVIDVAAREQAILKRVASEHVVRLHETLPLEDGSLAMVLDLADGGSLQDLVTIRGALDLGEVVTIFTPIATTLGELHAGGVIHSDLSPANILFTHAGKPMLGDYDAARLVGEQHPHTVSGTTGFVAPEVYRGALPTEASDIWSLAALAWYSITGGSPPPRNDVEAAAEATVGPVLAAILVPMLAADPARRPTAPNAAVAIYGTSAPAPVRLAGRNPDSACAMTHRIRQEAALEFSRSGDVTSAGRSPRSSTSAPPKGRAPREPLSVSVKLALIVVAALVFTGGMLLLLAKVNAKPIPPPSSVSSTSVSTPTTPPATSAPTAQLKADAQSVVQSLADARGGALMAADPARLLLCEVKDSSAYTSDIATLNQLTSQQQRYADLVFHVRSAEVVHVDDKSAQVLAVIDRAVYTVIGPGSARQQLPAREGRAFQYTLALGAQGWRITDIADG